MRINARHLTASGLIAAATLLAGCNAVSEIMGDGEQVDYKSTVRGDPLSIPPDLSSADIKPQYTAPGGAASASAYNQSVAAANAANAKGATVLPTMDGIEVRRSGDLRWLEINQDPNIVYPKLVAFWSDEGFTINRDNPKAGIIETDWAENRAKIPGNFLRRALGSIVDMVSDSGERERFHTRLERVNGKTEVYISHERMVETQMDRDGTEFKWLPANEDPGLNAAMLSRLMVYLGADKARAEQQIKQSAAAAPVINQPKTTRFVEGSTALSVNESQDLAWRRVGNALSASGFKIESSNATNGTYVIRYLDTDTGEKRQEANFITRLWGDKGNLTPLPYTIEVNAQGAQSLVTVRDQNGNTDTSTTARRILTVIAQKMN